MMKGPHPLFLALLLFAALSSCQMSPSHARALGSFVPTPLPYSCEQVRWAHANFTREHLLVMGKKLGVHLTGSQLREAENCLTKATP